MNPCLSCDIGQGCCTRMNGLKVSEAEYRSLFEPMGDKIIVEREGPLYKLRPADGGPCPHWDGECQIYDDRPMECGLFPHQIGVVFERDTLTVTVNDRTICPQKSELRSSDAEAVSRVRAWAEDLAGKGQSVQVVLETGLDRLVVLGRRAGRKLYRLIDASETPPTPAAEAAPR